VGLGVWKKSYILTGRAEYVTLKDYP
jgi:hypothetical protein